MVTRMIPVLVVVVVLCGVLLPARGGDDDSVVRSHVRHLTYVARLNEYAVHSLGVKRMWSGARRQELLDRKHADDSGSHAVDEHDPDEKRASLSDLLRGITDLALADLFVSVFEDLGHADQLWLVGERDAGNLPDLTPECGDGDGPHRPHDPLTCTVRFRSLRAVYGIHVDLHLTLTTKFLDLSRKEVDRRVHSVGLTQPIEFSTVRLSATVGAPNVNDKHVSEHGLHRLVQRLNDFLVVPHPLVTVEDGDVVPVSTIPRDVWKTMVEDVKEYEQRATPPPKDAWAVHDADVVVEVDNRTDQPSARRPEDDHRSQMERDGLAGLDGYLTQLVAEEEINDAAAAARTSHGKSSSGGRRHDEL